MTDTARNLGRGKIAEGLSARNYLLK